ncbi:protein DA1-related 2-like [Trifolium pratense]|uniref:Protein DA1-related 2-like n=1 Tax=Trifolium pratense TaxID=57577 RepID=A0A2K3P153_TRIPR|nr:protein DA1-related 2-like [Trifolium pratense]
MKWFGKIFKIGSNRGRSGGHHLQQPIDENMSWRAPPRSLDNRGRSKKEEEDLNNAIALSLSEDLKIPAGRWRTGADDDYAKALQDRTNSSLHPPYAPLPFYPRGYSMPSQVRICGGCNKEIHYGKHPYHKYCFKELSHPKCEVCHHYIPINGSGLIEYRCHPYWNQKYCPSHEYDNTARCCSCERLESRGERYFRLDDGRILCFECMESAITDTGECQPLYHAIRDYYEGMNMRIDQQIPMLLVGREALNEAIVGEKNGFHHLPETRGLCLSEEQTVTSVHRWSKIGGHRLIGMRSQPQKLIRKCEVTAILVLYGLPRLLTGAILAHELMHGWLRLKGYRNLDPAVEEGICQVLSYMWLEAEVMSGSRTMPSTSTASSSSSSSSYSSKKGVKSKVENKLGEFFMNQIANDSSPAYGGGFRSANAAVNKYGLRCTLDHIRLTGQLPL